jgi:hypothetical protein
VIHLLNEGIDVSALAAAKTMEISNLRANVKAWTALVMERAQTLHGTNTSALKSDVVPHDIRNV